MSINSIENLIDFISRLPSVGSRSAKNIVIEMLKDKQRLMIGFANLLQNTALNVKECSKCRNFDITDPCCICSQREKEKQICIVSEIKDLWNIEKSNCYKGLYYVLGGYLSTASSITPSDLQLQKLCQRIVEINAEEVIFALGSTMQAQTTYYYVLDEIEKFIKHQNLSTKITSLSFGIPMGSEIDYLDEGTINQAIVGRK